MTPFNNQDVESVFEKYPREIRSKMMHLRQLILDIADETEDINHLEEKLSWGEPSYKTKTGSTVRIDWKESEPDQYAMYFTCTTSLVDTFRKLYGDKFQFEGNRAITFNISDNLPESELKRCITLALTYHKVKHLPLLGV